jgi:ADP-heptose:LPS heptosyltransferase/lauroyl/myristoyl acyltransferase
MDRLIYLLALCLVTVIRLLPITVCFVLGQLVGLLVWMILPRYRRLSKQNLRIAFGPTLSGREAAFITLKHFLNLGANIVCSIKIPALSEKQLRARLQFDQGENWEDWIVGKKAGSQGTVAALSHFGNWEINAQIAEFVKPRKAGCVYQALRSTLMDDLVNRDRRSRGVHTFDRKKEMQGAATLLKEGGVVGVLTDQHAGNAGIWMPLFGKLASTSPLAASLAQRTGSLLAQVSVRTTGLARWVIHTSAPVPTAGREIAEITMDLNRLLEQEIRNSPADWFWVHNRWKTPHPNFLLNDVKRGIYLPPGTKTSDLQPFNILVRTPNWLGDACMSAPSIGAIKAGRPDLRLTILSPAKLAPLWRELPEVDAVIEIPAKASPWKVARLIRSSASKSSPTAYDVAILLPNSVRSALEVWLAGIPRRLGREIHRGGRLLNQRMSQKHQLHPTVHQADELLSMVRRLGAPEPQSMAPRTPPSGPIRIGLCPGAEYGPAKRWPTQRYRMVMERISRDHDLTWVIVGTAKEAPLGNDLSKNFPGKVENLCGKTTLPELIHHLKGFSLLLTNDTGTMHLADLLGVPVVAIFGSTEPSLTGPGHLGGELTPPHQILRRKVECSPCFLRECPIDFRCMKEITPEMVTEAVTESLQAIPEGV